MSPKLWTWSFFFVFHFSKLFYFENQIRFYANLFWIFLFISLKKLLCNFFIDLRNTARYNLNFERLSIHFAKAFNSFCTGSEAWKLQSIDLERILEFFAIFCHIFPSKFDRIYGFKLYVFYFNEKMSRMMRCQSRNIGYLLVPLEYLLCTSLFKRSKFVESIGLCSLSLLFWTPHLHFHDRNVQFYGYLFEPSFSRF